MKQKRGKKEHGDDMLWSPHACFDKDRTGPEQHNCGEHAWRRRCMDEMRGHQITVMCLFSGQTFIYSVLTFACFGRFLWRRRAVRLLLPDNSSPLLVERHRTVLRKAVKLLFKLFLQFPEAEESSSGLI